MDAAQRELSDQIDHATQRLLETALHAGVARFVFASSSSVYGTVGKPVASESDPPSPVSPYGG